MKKNILLVQFRENNLIAQHERDCVLRILGRKNKLIVKNIFSNNFRLSKNDFLGVSGIIIGGSVFNFSEKEKYPSLWARIERITPVFKKAINKNIPILGICFGHQYLAYVLGSEVVCAKDQQEVGTFEISLEDRGKKEYLFHGVPSKFFAQEAHKDSVKNLPPKSILLATSKRCKIQAFRFRNIYGVQFHPELNVKDMKFRANLNPSYVQGKKMRFKTSVFGRKIIENFLHQVDKK